MTQRLSPDPEIDALIQKLNASAGTDGEELVERETPPGEAASGHGALQRSPRWPLPEPDHDGEQWMRDMMARARKAHASDLLLVVGAPPAIRVDGRIVSGADKPLTHGEIGLICAALVPASRRATVEQHGAVDFSRNIAGLGRIRANVHRERGHWAASVRLFSDKVPDLKSLHLPEDLGRFIEIEHGLVLVTGPTGSGKSTTLAALVQRLLGFRGVHLITIEDPVEYVHEHAGSLVEHIEIGRDAPSFGAALRAALRQDPDVLLIGEMRDAESISIAISAAETGHLVLSTLHTGDAPQTIHRILDSYPANQIDTVRAQLSVSLAGIVSQQLLPRRDGKGRVPAVEILVATPGVRNLIRRGKVEQLRSQITLEHAEGMRGLDESLARLVEEGLVDEAEARFRARVPEEFKAHLARPSRRKSR